MLDSLGFKYDPNLYERLFWLFDINGNGYIQTKEIVIGLELFREHTLDEKITRK